MSFENGEDFDHLLSGTADDPAKLLKKNGAGGRARTCTALRPGDFKFFLRSATIGRYPNNRCRLNESLVDLEQHRNRCSPLMTNGPGTVLTQPRGARNLTRDGLHVGLLAMPRRLEHHYPSFRTSRVTASRGAPGVGAGGSDWVPDTRSHRMSLRSRTKTV